MLHSGVASAIPNRFQRFSAFLFCIREFNEFVVCDVRVIRQAHC